MNIISQEHSPKFLESKLQVMLITSADETHKDSSLTSEENTILGLVAHEGLHPESGRAGRTIRLLKKKKRKEKPINGITTLEVLGSQRQFRPEVD